MTYKNTDPDYPSVEDTYPEDVRDWKDQMRREREME